MSDPQIKLWSLVFEALKTIGIFAGAAWAFWRFRRERVDAPQVAFSVDAKFLDPAEKDYPAEFKLTFENKGKTRVEVKRLELRVRGIKDIEAIEFWPSQGERLHFPHKLIDEPYVMPKKYGYTFFEPGIKQDYIFVSKIPKVFKYILVRACFYYPDGDQHSAERVFQLEAQKADSRIDPTLTHPSSTPR